jgi:hypothetical protein
MTVNQNPPNQNLQQVDGENKKKFVILTFQLTKETLPREQNSENQEEETETVNLATPKRYA